MDDHDLEHLPLLFCYLHNSGFKDNTVATVETFELTPLEIAQILMKLLLHDPLSL